ncbi:hypothetical protein AB0395_06290 [Streptosporangium sp. NPDC051023]|uniref:hypothetical protein n=1 Tax=Streptosporangium sp. NPDC051023 TaxID=3155410 RepID=UPI00344F16A9
MLESKVRAACEKFQEILTSCEGGFIDTVTLNATREGDDLDVKLLQTQKWEAVAVFFKDVRYFSISKGTDLEGVFVDQILVSHLPKTGQAWPSGAEELVTRFDELPELYWVQFIGPSKLSVIAAIMTVTVSQDLPEN